MRTVKALCVAALLCALTTAPSVKAADAGNTADAFLQSRLAAAEALLKDGRYSQALEVADALLALKPEETFAAKVSAFRLKALDAQTQAEVLQCEIVPEKKIYLAGETPRIAVRLFNRSLDEVRIPLKEKEGAKPDKEGKVPMEFDHLLLAANFSDYTALGSSQKNSTKSWNEEIKDEITLAPGDFFERVIEPDGLTEGIGGMMVRKVSISVTFAPLIVKGVDKDRFIAPYRAEQYAFMVLPKEAGPLMANPAESLKRALRDENAAAIFTSALALGQNNQNLALRLLAGALRDARPNSAAESAIICAMQHNLGVYQRRTREDWLAWWDKSWTYYCADEPALPGPRIAVIKTGDSYLITLDGDKMPLADIAARLKTLASEGAVRAEITCGRDVALAQFMEVYQAVRTAGIRDIMVAYAETVAP